VLDDQGHHGDAQGDDDIADGAAGLNESADVDAAVLAEEEEIGGGRRAAAQ
jgi:hypothetical protein